MSRPVEQEPTEVKSNDFGRDGGRSFTHPAFGQIQANRVQGSTTLYDSDFIHHNYITIRVTESQLNRDLSRDWHYSGKTLIEVKLSEAQWATFVSSMNMGGGVPCTLARIGGEAIPGLPHREEKSVVDEEFARRTGAMADKVQRTIEAIAAAGLSKKKTEELTASLVRLRRDLDESLPFMAKSFDEHMEKTVERGKVEVHGYINGVLTRAGMERLGASESPLVLRSGEETGGAPDGADTEQYFNPGVREARARDNEG